MRVGFDVGGTFTDVVAQHADGRIGIAKLLSVLDRLPADIARFIERTGGEEAVELFVHGTTIAANAVIEGNPTTVGLLTTAGFRDELEMRGQRRPNIYDSDWDRLPPLVPRRLRLELGERVRADGAIERPLQCEEVDAALHKLRDAGVEAVAVCLMNSYANPTHERLVLERAEQLLGGVPVCASVDVNPEIREYERTSTTVVNASLVPVVGQYLDRLERGFRDFSRPILVMQSNGGIMDAAEAKRLPASMIESGPAAGVLAAARLAAECSEERVLSFDVGGTTAKACLIDNGIPLEKAGGEIGGEATIATGFFGRGGHAVRLPSLDIVEVGTGGGSIAWVGHGGELRVGPESAGAAPGPVCYGRGGRRPTVTDANVVLGRINPDAIAGSALPLDADAARHALSKEIAEPLGLDVLTAAHGIVQVANSTMMRALRAVSTERGKDVRDYTLIAFGGAGPLHAAELAETLAVRRILVPPFPGVFSALGLLLADYRSDLVQSLASPLDALSSGELEVCFGQLQQEGLDRLMGQGVPAEAVRFERRADARYEHQPVEMTLKVGRHGDLVEELRSSLASAHAREYGYVRDEPVNLVNIRLRVIAPSQALPITMLRPGEEATIATEGQRTVHFGAAGSCRTDILSRGGIGRGERLDGPVIVEEADSTIVVPPGWRVTCDESWNLVLTC